MKLTRLFEPISIGKMEVKNRIVMPAIHLNWSQGGFLNGRIESFYRLRAKGGVGLIVIGGASVEPCETSFPRMIGIWDDEFIPGLRKLAEILTPYGCRIVAQLFHGGIAAKDSGLSPLKLASKALQEISVEGIEGIEDSFAEAARRAVASGFDGIELMASAGYLLSQFLSPLTNTRKDKYGGDLQGRTTFIINIIGKIRRRIGDDYLLFCRLGGHDFVEGSNTHQEAKLIAKALEGVGTNAINVVGGWHETNVPEVTMCVPRGAFVYLARGIKEVVSIPVVASNRIVDPSFADDILKNGDADMVSMGRALIADPDLPIKAMKGDLSDIRQCIACNQGCFDAVFEGSPISCLVNAEVGNERDDELGKPALRRALKVLVVGGGPAGLEASRVAALRGHHVTLYEQTDQLGGQLNLAAIPPGRGEFATLVRYLSGQMVKLGVKVILGKKVTEQIIDDEKPDVVVVATGATPSLPPIPGIDHPGVFLAADVLAGRVDMGNKVVIIGGGAVGCETAHFVAKMGAMNAETALFLAEYKALDWEGIMERNLRGHRKVTVLEMLPKLGSNIGVSTRWTIIQQLRRCGVTMLSNIKIEAIKDRFVAYSRNGKEENAEADTVIIATGYKSDTELLDNLRKREGLKVYAIGDCVEPRKAYEAIHEGFEVGSKIGSTL